MLPLFDSAARLYRYAFAGAAIATLLFAGVLADAPEDASRAIIAAPPLLSLPSVFVMPVLTIRRNPFAAPATPPPLDDFLHDPTAGMVLPPNAAAGAPVLRAIVGGPQPKALIDIGGRPSVVGIGSALAGSTVVAIGKTAVVLDDGRTLHLTQDRP